MLTQQYKNVLLPQPNKSSPGTEEFIKKESEHKGKASETTASKTIAPSKST